MSFNKKFLNKSPLASQGGPHNYQPDVTANTKAFSTPSDIMKKKVLEARQPEKSLTKTLLSTADNVAKSLTPVGVVKDLYNSAKDVYSDYQKGDYKSLGKKAATEVALNLAPYGVGKAVKPVMKAVKKSMKNISPNQILDGIGPRALKNDGTLKRGVNEAGFKDFKNTGIVRSKQGGVTNKVRGFELGKDFSKNNATYASPKINVAKDSRYYGPGGAIYGIKNPNIKFKKRYEQGNWSMVTKDPITKPDVDVYTNYPIIGFRNF